MTHSIIKKSLCAISTLKYQMRIWPTPNRQNTPHPKLFHNQSEKSQFPNDNRLLLPDDRPALGLERPWNRLADSLQKYTRPRTRPWPPHGIDRFNVLADVFFSLLLWGNAWLIGFCLDIEVLLCCTVISADEVRFGLGFRGCTFYKCFFLFIHFISFSCFMQLRAFAWSGSL